MEKPSEKLQRDIMQFLSSNYEILKEIVNNYSCKMPTALREECLAFISKQEDAAKTRKREYDEIEELIRKRHEN